MSCTYNKEINEKIKNYLTESIVDWLEANEYDEKDCKNSPFLTYWNIIKSEINGGIYDKYSNFEKWKHFHMGFVVLVLIFIVYTKMMKEYQVLS